METLVPDFDFEDLNFDELKTLHSPTLTELDCPAPSTMQSMGDFRSSNTYDHFFNHAEDDWMNFDCPQMSPTQYSSQLCRQSSFGSNCRLMASSNYSRFQPYCSPPSLTSCSPVVAAPLPARTCSDLIQRRTAPVYQTLDVPVPLTSVSCGNSVIASDGHPQRPQQQRQLQLQEETTCLPPCAKVTSDIRPPTTSPEATKKKPGRRGRRATSNDVEPLRQDRRRQSNRRAAEKYRIKQRAQSDSIKTERERLAMQNQDLIEENQKLQHELKLLKEVIAKHGMVCPMSQ